jgi:hypothetical protein
MLEVKSQKLEGGSEKTELDQEIIEHRVSIDQLRYEHPAFGGITEHRASLRKEVSRNKG